MGEVDKASCQLAGRTLLQHCIERLALSSAPIKHIVINANGDPERFSQTGLPVISDQNQDFAGPLAGILAGLDWAGARNLKRIVTIAADTPFFPPPLPQALYASQVGSKPSLATFRNASNLERVQPIFGCWPSALRDDLRHHLLNGHHKVREWANLHDAHHVRFDAYSHASHAPLGDPFFNINTPEDLMRAQEFIRAE
jgi:molybdopterin-guanine dinucleotide biosynthesis protein A